DPTVSVVCFRVRTGGVEHAFDRVRGTGDVGAAFDSCKRWRDQHHQKANDADDDEQFEQRKSPDALTLLQQRKAAKAATPRRGQSSEGRCRRKRSFIAAGTAAFTEKHSRDPCHPWCV